eukprot:632226-Amphidinium_carterae.1
MEIEHCLGKALLSAQHTPAAGSMSNHSGGLSTPSRLPQQSYRSSLDARCSRVRRILRARSFKHVEHAIDPKSICNLHAWRQRAVSR